MKAYEQIYQGDVWVMRLPDDMKITHEAEKAYPQGKLIIQEGEMTGHHHYVDTIEKDASVDDDIDFSVLDSPSLKKMFEKRATPTAKFYTASKLAEELVQSQVLLRADLVIGLLEIENGPMNLYHQEHGSVTLAPGKYVTGRQIESVAGEERRVAD
jgi:hypothetical protein